jgi:hypothetical protein
LHIAGSNSSPATGYLIREKFFKKKRAISLNPVLCLTSSLEQTTKTRNQPIVIFKDNTFFWKQFRRWLEEWGEKPFLFLPYKEIIRDYHQICQVLILYITAIDGWLKCP